MRRGLMATGVVLVAAGCAEGPQDEATTGPEVSAAVRALESDGATGWTGWTGVEGNSGAEGFEGWTGAEGATGTWGPEGFTGARGPVGTRGPDGFRGPRGPGGAEGETGAEGGTGADGRPGATGWTGPRGTQGPVGVQGVAGDVLVAEGGITAQRLYPAPGKVNYGVALDPGETVRLEMEPPDNPLDVVLYFREDGRRVEGAAVRFEPSAESTTGWYVVVTDTRDCAPRLVSVIAEERSAP